MSVNDPGSHGAIEQPHSEQTAEIEALRARLSHARCVTVLTGAGISVESGLSTFRDPGGLWQQYRPEDLANERAFRRNPELVQEWYGARRSRAAAAEPNAGHLAIAQLETLIPEFLLVTQNVDGLHERAGNRDIVELHGSILREYCIECGNEGGHDAVVDSGLRRCPLCSGLLRPGVVWFGETLPDGAFERAVRAASRSDVFLSVGTSALVYPAAGLPLLAKESGAFTVEVNLEPSAVAHVMDLVLVGRAGTILPDLIPGDAEQVRSRTFATPEIRPFFN